MIEPTDEMVADAMAAYNATGAYRSAVAAVLALVERDYSLRPATCEAMQEGDWIVICELPRGHSGTHSATVERAVHW